MKKRYVLQAIAAVAFVAGCYFGQKFFGEPEGSMSLVYLAIPAVAGFVAGVVSVMWPSRTSLEDKAIESEFWQGAIDDWCCKQGVYFNCYVAIAATKDVLYEKSRCVITVNQGGTPNNPDKRFLVTLQMRGSEFVMVDDTEIDDATYLSMVNIRQVVNKSYSTL